MVTYQHQVGPPPALGKSSTIPWMVINHPKSNTFPWMLIHHPKDDKVLFPTWLTTILRADTLHPQVGYQESLGCPPIIPRLITHPSQVSHPPSHGWLGHTPSMGQSPTNNRVVIKVQREVEFYSSAAQLVILQNSFNILEGRKTK